MAKWDKAVRRALDDNPGDLAEAVRWEMALLWSDLGEEERRAANGTWSTGCDSVTERIVHLSRLAGATPWTDVEIPLLRSGLYEGILRSAGIEFTPPDMAEVARSADDAESGWPR